MKGRIVFAVFALAALALLGAASSCTTDYRQLQLTDGSRSGATGGSVGGSGINDASLPENQQLPSPSKIVTVSGASQLTSAVSSASDGMQIILKNGSYGAVTLSKDFSASNPLVIKAENPLGATFSFLAIEGDGIVVSGVSVKGSRQGTDGSLTAVDITGSNVRLTRCKIDAEGGYHALAITRGTGALVDHCDIGDFTNRGIFFNEPASGMILAKNYIHTTRGRSCRSECASLALGSNWQNRNFPLKAVARYNYFEKSGGEGPADDKHVHFKSSDNTIAFNMFACGSVDFDVDNRSGLRNKVIGNNGCSRLLLADYDMVVLGNKWPYIRASGASSPYFSREETESSGSQAEANCITITCKPVGTEPTLTPAARNVKLAGNITTDELIIGIWPPGANAWCKDPFIPTPVEGVEIYDHNKAPSFVDLDNGPKCDANFTWYKNVTNKWEDKAPISWGIIPKPVDFPVTAVGPNAQ